MAAADEEDNEPMTFQTTDPNGAHGLTDGADDWIFVDIRTVEEFDGGHVPGSFNIPFLFRPPTGPEPNPEFVSAMKRHFASDAKLVLC